jgi:hypothetical protein
MYKVSATYRDGFRAAGTVTIIGRDCVAKARRCGELVLQRVREAGFKLRQQLVECLGHGDGAGNVIESRSARADGFAETVLRVAVETDSKEAAECFARELMPFVTAGPQGTTGYAEGRPRVHPVFRYWPCLIGRDAVTPRVEVVVSAESRTRNAEVSSFTIDVRERVATSDLPSLRPSLARPPRGRVSCLYDIACARSGDKGTDANVGIITRSAESWEFLRSWLTADRVADFFAALNLNGVERYELPSLQALNFVLRGALRQSLRTDVQGKALGLVLLEMPLPDDIARTMPADKPSTGRRP